MRGCSEQLDGLLYTIEIGVAVRTSVKVLLDLLKAQRVEFQVKMVQHMLRDILALDVCSAGWHDVR